MRSSDSYQFRMFFLPYCLQRLADGSYEVLNRKYMPLGLFADKAVEGQELPMRFKFKRALSARQVAALSFNGDTSTERIFLYNDSCVPTGRDAHWKAYAKRLKKLAAYKVLLP